MPFKRKTPAEGIYTEIVEKSIFGFAGIPIFEAACIAQLIQVELLLHRCAASNLERRLCQILDFSTISV